MKNLFSRILEVILVMVFALTFTASAEEAQPTDTAGATLTVGDWTLTFTEVTDDQEAIMFDQENDPSFPPGVNHAIFMPSEGFKTVRLKIEVPPECKKENCDDLKVSLIEKNGDEQDAAGKVTSTRNNQVFKLVLLFAVHDDQALDDITLRVEVTGQGENTWPLKDLMGGSEDIIAALPMGTTIEFELGSVTLQSVDENNTSYIPEGMKEDEKPILIIMLVTLNSQIEVAYKQLYENACVMDSSGYQYHASSEMSFGELTANSFYVLLYAIPKDAEVRDMVFCFAGQQRKITPLE